MIVNGNTVPVMSFVVGSRKDINTRIGAIAVVSEKKDVKRYLAEFTGPGLVCSFSSFNNWGLPDRNLTYFAARLKDKSKNIDGVWYSFLSECPGLVYHSTSFKMNNLTVERRKIMAVFYIMILIVIVSGMLSVSLSLYTRGRLYGKEFSYMRAQGMKISQIAGLMIYENLYYPLVGVLVSLIPVALMQKLLVTIRANLLSGRWNPDNDLNSGRGLPWYLNLPYNQDILNKHTPLIMAAVLILLIVLLLLAMIPQISYLKKRSIIDELDDTSF
ncbi:MAG: FtsX-like permease family protein [Lachnospiraceae bacterium]|nr:FtsX-like permease family protein [Lachnospiraceae bacterium]MEE3460761.1 FtsX-like permease family protein [Lachnospiraceae bacterium]